MCQLGSFWRLACVGQGSKHSHEMDTLDIVDAASEASAGQKFDGELQEDGELKMRQQTLAGALAGRRAKSGLPRSNDRHLRMARSDCSL